MSECKSEFDEFLRDIRPTATQKSYLRKGHQVLRDRLEADAVLSKCIVSTFLQGSYRRFTAVRPKGEQRPDVDIIVVTKFDEAEFTPTQAMAKFEPFLNTHYKDKWRLQGRSFGIELVNVDLDMVITSAPSEAEIGILKSAAVRTDADLEDEPDWVLNMDWRPLEGTESHELREMLKSAAKKAEWPATALRIPDTNAEKWDSTHPLEQLKWTRDKNKITSRCFVNIVKALKWWRVAQHPELKHPKGFPLERMIGDCCPDVVTSMAGGIVSTLEEMVRKYAPKKPFLPDYGVPEHDVLKRISPEDFATFFELIKQAALDARAAFDAGDRDVSRTKWHTLFGSKFPKTGGGGGGGGGGKNDGVEEPDGPAAPGSQRFGSRVD